MKYGIVRMWVMLVFSALKIGFISGRYCESTKAQDW